DHYKTVIARHLAYDFAGIEDHGKTLARALGVPEHPQLAAPFAPAQKGIKTPVHADKLVVLGDDLLAALVVNHKVFQIIQQLFRHTQALQKTLGAGAVGADLLTADFFL